MKKEKKAAASKMYLLRRSSHSENVWRCSFSKNKVVLKMSQHMRDGKSRFEKKNKLD